MTKRIAYLLATAVFPLLILWATFTPHSRSSAGGSAVLIDAVYYDTIANGQPDEAIRIINVSGGTTDISNWQLNDAIDTSMITFPNNVLLSPNQSIWVTRNAAAFKRQFGFLPMV